MLDKYLKPSNHETRMGFGFAEDAPDPAPDGKEATGSTSSSAGAHLKKSNSDTPITDHFGTDLTRLAAEGGLDPVVGREEEIRRMAQILSRRKKNNPIIIGEPGVGKSALVEGLALLIAQKKAVRALTGKRIVALDMATMVAGTQYRGQFEERLKRLVDELRAHPEIIVFIDEVHTIVGAGSAPGSLDAAGMLKPALARGEVQCIGATTLSEYRKSIEKDGALERRFQKILLSPTTAEETLLILQRLQERYEEHHVVKFTPAAIEACVRLSERYITDRALPDKAIDVMDEAGSRVRMSGIVVPQSIRDKETEIEMLKTQKTEAAKRQDYELAARLRDAASHLTIELEELNREWAHAEKQNYQVVDETDVAAVVSVMTGIPAGRMLESENARLKGMAASLGEQVIAQEEAIGRLVKAITRSRLGIKSPNRPIGTFLFVGPTGVGKTHLVKSLAEWMFGSKDALIRIDMSEYGEKHSTSRMVGAPPGYVGYDEGGQLTERVRRRPYSVVLLDEIEKAHPDVWSTLLQVMDEGRMTDGGGTTADFRNTIIVMTSNCGTRQLKDFGGGMGFGASSEPDAELAESVVMKALKKQFAPEFLNRLDDIIVFQSLRKEDALKIAAIEIKELQDRLAEQGIHLEVTEQATEFIVSKGFDAQYGARSLKRSLQQHLEDALCDYMLEHNDKELRAECSDDKIVICSK